MNTTFSNPSLVSKMLALEAPRSFALALWCLDRSLAIFNVAELERTPLAVKVSDVRRRAEMFWTVHGLSGDEIHPVRDFCDAFDIEEIEIKAIDAAQLRRFFPGCDEVAQDNIINAMLNSAAILSSILRSSKDESAESLSAIFESYYDIYYQVTYDVLRGTECVIVPELSTKIEAALNTTDPLRTALRLLEAQADLLSSIDKVAFTDPRLRGKESR